MKNEGVSVKLPKELADRAQARVSLIRDYPSLEAYVQACVEVELEQDLAVGEYTYNLAEPSPGVFCLVKPERTG